MGKKGSYQIRRWKKKGSGRKQLRGEGGKEWRNAVVGGEREREREEKEVASPSLCSPLILCL